MVRTWFGKYATQTGASWFQAKAKVLLVVSVCVGRLLQGHAWGGIAVKMPPQGLNTEHTTTFGVSGSHLVCSAPWSSHIRQKGSPMDLICPPLENQVRAPISRPRTPSTALSIGKRGVCDPSTPTPTITAGAGGQIMGACVRTCKFAP